MENSKYYSKNNLKKLSKIKKVIDELNRNIGVNNIICAHKEKEYGIKFIEFLNLYKSREPKEITKILKINTSRLIEQWYRGNIPDSIKTLIEIYKRKYHKLDKKTLTYLVGWGFGDGGMTKKLSYYFLCGKKEDLKDVKKYLTEKIKGKMIIESNDGNNLIEQANGKIIKIKGESWILRINDPFLCKLLNSFGLPKGNKVLQKTNLPAWIKNGNKEIKKTFLNAIFEGELQKHRVKNNIIRNKIDICPITFGLSKIEKHKVNLIELLEEIKSILKEFQIECGEVEKPKASNLRKDGLITYCSRFYISISAQNTIRFSNIIDYKFNREKRKSLVKAIKEAKRKIKKMKLQLNKYNKALKLYDNGISIYKVSKIIDVEYCTARYWLKTKEHLPRLKTEVSNEI